MSWQEKRNQLLYGILLWILTMVVLQLWLLTATMDGFLGKDYSVVWASGFASLACFVLNMVFFRYLRSTERNW